MMRTGPHLTRSFTAPTAPSNPTVAIQERWFHNPGVMRTTHLEIARFRSEAV